VFFFEISSGCPGKSITFLGFAINVSEKRRGLSIGLDYQLGLGFNFFCLLLNMWSENEVSWREIHQFKIYMIKMNKNEIF
jgi:hypothetical protein